MSPTTPLLLDDPATQSWVSYEPDFLPGADADALFAFLRANAPFQAEAPVIFGKAIPVRRESCAYGDAGTRYRYSGLVRPAALWPAALLPTLERLRVQTKTPFSFVLCNHYPDGDAGLGWHSDDESDLVRGAAIASISLGAVRDFAFRKGASGKTVLTVPLAHGSLLVMGGATQQHYQHRIPERRRVTQPRINLTFRQMSGP